MTYRHIFSCHILDLYNELELVYLYTIKISGYLIIYPYMYILHIISTTSGLYKIGPIITTSQAVTYLHYINDYLKYLYLCSLHSKFFMHHLLSLLLLRPHYQGPIISTSHGGFDPHGTISVCYLVASLDFCLANYTYVEHYTYLHFNI